MSNKSSIRGNVKRNTKRHSTNDGSYLDRYSCKLQTQFDKGGCSEIIVVNGGSTKTITRGEHDSRHKGKGETTTSQKYTSVILGALQILQVLRRTNI